MRYWDSSALVCLLVQHSKTAVLLKLVESDPSMVTWWLSDIECVSALSRQERERTLSSQALGQGVDLLDQLQNAWNEVQPTVALRQIARRLLRVHALRAADACQLAAAIVISETSPAGLEFVTLDRRLMEAASKEGFQSPALLGDL